MRKLVHWVKGKLLLKSNARKDRAILLDREGSKRWYDSQDDLPLTADWVVGYTEVFGTYYICQFIPSRGWVNMNGDSLANISQWCDDGLYLPFEIRNELNTYLAEKHGFKIQ